MGRTVRSLAQKGYLEGVQPAGMREDMRWQWSTPGMQVWLRRNRRVIRIEPLNLSHQVSSTDIPKPIILQESSPNENDC